MIRSIGSCQFKERHYFSFAVKLLLVSTCLLGCVQCECRNDSGDDGHYVRIQCELVTIPSDIPSTVAEISLNKNNIKTIPDDTFSQFKKCSLLSLSENLLTKITQQMFSGLTSVTYLFLDNNQIFHIAPGTFTTLPSLVHV